MRHAPVRARMCVGMRRERERQAFIAFACIYSAEKGPFDGFAGFRARAAAAAAAGCVYTSAGAMTGSRANYA